MRLSPSQQAQLLQIARNGVLERLGDPITLGEPTSDPELSSPGGCFVSLHESGSHRLRGCVGRLESPDPLWKVVYETAKDVLGDPRFNAERVSASEIPMLEIEVSVLSPPSEAPSPLEFDLLNEGIYLTCDGRAGFFLPQVAQQTGWTKELLLARLCTEKLGLSHDAWERPDAKLFTFEVEVIGPATL